MIKKFFCLSAALLLLIILPAGCTPAQQSYSKTGTYFDTVIKLTVYQSKDARYLDGCMELAAHYEQLFSRTIKDSDISRINAAEGAYVQVDQETIDLIRAGLTYCQLSGGVFDITLGEVSDLWNFKEHKDGSLPDPDSIKEAVSHVNYKNVKLKGTKAALTDPDASLDLGGIAKGYIADRMKEYLEDNGVSSGMINLGGNVITIGEKPDGTDYQIAIQKPFDESGTPIGSVKIDNKSMVTSGTYQRCFEKDGIIYHHILDPKTGYPIENHLESVTIISDQSVDGDGLSTTCLALGLEKGMELIENTDHTEAVFITDDGKVHTTSGFEDQYQFIPYK